MANKPAKTRMCIACRTPHEKSEMQRVVRTASGEAVLDKTGKTAGRGAYICKNHTCIEKAANGKKIERALSCRIDTEIYTQLGEMYA